MNIVNLTGRVGQDPRTVKVGEKSVSNFSLATKEWGKEPKTEWHKIVVWEKDNLIPMVKKGSHLAITGRLQTHSYEKDGVKHYSTEVIANNIEFLDKKEVDSSSAQASQKYPEPGDDLPF